MPKRAAVGPDPLSLLFSAKNELYQKGRNNMKIDFLKLKKKNLPRLQSLRPAVFSIESRWLFDLGVAFVILLTTFCVGFKFFSTVYFESYKESDAPHDFENLINAQRLENTVEKINYFLKAKLPATKDPSL